jgi:hypothetical protein
MKRSRAENKVREAEAKVKAEARWLPRDKIQRPKEEGKKPQTQPE